MLNIETYEKALIANNGMTNGNWDAGGTCGGINIPEISVYRNKHLFAHLFSATTEEKYSIQIETAIFGGYIFHHFGHFILESICRLYALESFQADTPIVFISPTPTLSKWQNDILANILKIDLSRIQIISEGNQAHIGKLFSPKPGYIIPKNFNEENIKYLGKYTSYNQKKIKKVWFSRSLLKERMIENENILQELLRDNGWFIFNPESHSLDEQLKIYNTAERVAGFSGSAFHSLLLTKKPTCTIEIFKLEMELNENFTTIAEAKGINQIIYDVGMKPIVSTTYSKTKWSLDDKTIERIIKTLQNLNLTGSHENSVKA